MTVKHMQKIVVKILCLTQFLLALTYKLMKNRIKDNTKAKIIRLWFNLYVIQLVYYTFLQVLSASLFLSYYFNNIFKMALDSLDFQAVPSHAESIAQKEETLYCPFNSLIYNVYSLSNLLVKEYCQVCSVYSRQQLATITTSYISLYCLFHTLKLTISLFTGTLVFLGYSIKRVL